MACRQRWGKMVATGLGKGLVDGQPMIDVSVVVLSDSLLENDQSLLGVKD